MLLQAQFSATAGLFWCYILIVTKTYAHEIFLNNNFIKLRIKVIFSHNTQRIFFSFAGIN